MKERVLNMDRKELLGLFDTSFNGGVFSFEQNRDRNEKICSVH